MKMHLYGLPENPKMLLIHGVLLPAGRVVSAVMSKAFQKFVHKSQTRDPKTLESLKKNFLPERFMEAFLALADLVSDTSIENMVYSMCQSELRMDVDN